MCMVCSGTTRKYFEKNQGPFGVAEYYQCDECGFIYTGHIESTSYHTVNEFYSTCDFDIEDSGYKSRAETAFNALSKLLHKHKLEPGKIKLLDYGCGEGTFLRICRENDIDAYGYDPFYKNEMDNTLEDMMLENNKKQFDVVTAFEVVEHSCSMNIFHDIMTFCKPNGLFMFSTGIFNPLIHNNDWEYFSPAHCSFHTTKSLAVIAEKLHCERIELMRNPFERIPYLLTGEIWRNSKSDDCKLPSIDHVNMLDSIFDKLASVFPKRFYKLLAKLVYSNQYIK